MQFYRASEAGGVGHIWAEAQQKQENDQCAQSRLRPAWHQADLSLSLGIQDKLGGGGGGGGVHVRKSQ